MEPALRETQAWVGGAFRRIAYAEWGDPADPPVLCVHGLTRTGRDFDPLAAAIAPRFRVICPDLPGRGRSDWLPDPVLYEPFTYVQALIPLLAILGEGGHRVAWVGTSLGGICGMAAAASPDHPLGCLMLNDIGPRIPAEGLARIQAYAGQAPRFPDLDAAEAYLRQVHAPFGKLTDAQWREMARFSTRPDPRGGYAPHYDPAIMHGMAEMRGDADFTPWWSRIALPILAVRGADSDILTSETLAGMAADGCETHEVPSAGHAPALADAETIGAVARFLERHASRPA